MRSITIAAAAVALALGVSVSAMAQEQRARTANDAPSWIPGTTHGYVGFSVGRSRFDDGTCIAGFSCENRDTAFSLYGGGKFNPYFGLELGYIDFGEVGRNGGEWRAHGLNLGLVGSIPVGPQFSLVGKVGTMYSRTRISAATPAVGTGKDDGFGLSYGLGARLDLARNWALRADWDRYRTETVGSDGEISLYSIGLQYKF